MKLAQKGFSLIEIILVVFCASLIVFLVANIPNSLKLIGTSSRESVAKEIASKAIEDIRSQSYANMLNGNSLINDSRLATLPNSAGTITVSDCDLTICTNGESIKEVLVTVSWVESGNSKNVKLTTLVAENGL